MTMTATMARLPQTARAGWDEQIVPALRRRLETESTELSRRMSQSFSPYTLADAEPLPVVQSRPSRSGSQSSIPRYVGDTPPPISPPGSGGSDEGGSTSARVGGLPTPASSRANSPLATRAGSSPPQASSPKQRPGTGASAGKKDAFAPVAPLKASLFHESMPEAAGVGDSSESEADDAEYMRPSLPSAPVHRPFQQPAMERSTSISSSTSTTRFPSTTAEDAPYPPRSAIPTRVRANTNVSLTSSKRLSGAEEMLEIATSGHRDLPRPSIDGAQPTTSISSYTLSSAPGGRTRKAVDEDEEDFGPSRPRKGAPSSVMPKTQTLPSNINTRANGARAKSTAGRTSSAISPSTSPRSSPAARKTPGSAGRKPAARSPRSTVRSRDRSPSPDLPGPMAPWALPPPSAPPPSGNWDEVVIPTVARKLELQKMEMEDPRLSRVDGLISHWGKDGRPIPGARVEVRERPRRTGTGGSWEYSEGDGAPREANEDREAEAPRLPRSDSLAAPAKSNDIELSPIALSAQPEPSSPPPPQQQRPNLQVDTELRTKMSAKELRKNRPRIEVTSPSTIDGGLGGSTVPKEWNGHGGAADKGKKGKKGKGADDEQAGCRCTIM